MKTFIFGRIENVNHSSFQLLAKYITIKFRYRSILCNSYAYF